MQIDHRNHNPPRPRRLTRLTLHQAARSGDVVEVRRLVAIGADEQDAGGWTTALLHFSTLGGQGGSHAG
jgi:hypothetical protein